MISYQNKAVKSSDSRSPDRPQTVKRGRPRDGLHTVARLVAHGVLTNDHMIVAARLITALHLQAGTVDSCGSLDREIAGSRHTTKSRTERRTGAVIDSGRLLSPWVAVLKNANIEPAVVIAILVGQSSLSGLDRLWQRRNGWARAQLIRSLELFSAGIDHDGRQST